MFQPAANLNEDTKSLILCIYFFHQNLGLVKKNPTINANESSVKQITCKTQW